MKRVLELRFRLRGYDGTVFVDYGVNDDPPAWGFDLLHLPFDLALVHGFPLLLASIDYAGPGYRALMGWIQVVTVEMRQPEQTVAETDVYPIHWPLDTPFVTFGQHPTVFDAPGPNPPRTDERWTAETFLAVCPDGARTRTVVPVLGFSWGYDLQQMRATSFPPAVATEADWKRCLLTLSDAYPDWEFRSEFLITM